MPGEADTPPTFVAQRTLEDWYYAFKKGGFDALRVELELEPWLKDPVFVRYKGQHFGQARKVDRHLNSRLDGTEARP